jgi:hypothetical protein
VDREAELLEVVRTLRYHGGLPNFLDRRQKQANQNRNDGNDHEQFDQGKTLFDIQPGQAHVRVSFGRGKREKNAISTKTKVSLKFDGQYKLTDKSTSRLWRDTPINLVNHFFGR